MKKRLISLLVVAVMLAGMLPVMSVSAADTVLYGLLEGGWSAVHSNASRHESERAVWTATGESSDGDNKSLYANYKTYDNNGKLSFVTLYNSGLTASDIKPGTYHLSFDLKGKATTFSALIGGWDKNHRKYFFNEETTVENWTKYSADITVAEGNTADFRFIVEGAANQFYLDNVVVTYEDDTTNLIDNGSYAGYPVSAPEKTADLYKWTATPKGGEKTAIAKVADGVSYSGDKSMYIKYEADDYGSKWMNVVNDEFKTYDASSYTLEFYAKGNFYNNLGSQVYMGMYRNESSPWSTFSPNSNGNKSLWKMCHMTVSELDDSNPKKAEGWRKYTAVINGTFKSAFQITVQSECELYIDDMSIKANNTGDNLFANPGFEEEEKILDEVEDPAADSLSDVGTGWSVSFQGETKEDGVGTIIKETTHFAYEGEKSLYVKYSPINRSSSDSLVIQNLGLTQAEPDKTYRVSFYLKGDYVWKGENYKDDIAFTLGLGWAWNNTRIRMSRQTPQTPEEAAKAEEGWEKYSFEISTAGFEQSKLIKFSIFLMDYCEMYLDNITLEEKISDGVYSSNLLTNSGFEGVKEYAVLSDVPSGWSVVYSGNNPYTVKRATGVSYSGNDSLHVSVTDFTSDKGYLWIANDNWKTVKTGDTKTYKIEFYAKGDFAGKGATAAADKLDSFFVMTGWGWGTGIKKMTDSNQHSESTPENAAKASEGWVKYTCTIDTTSYDSSKALPFYLGFNHTCDLYIDDITVTDITDESATNLMANPGFEADASTSLDIVGTRLFDADDVAIDSISAQGGREVTTVAYAINNSGVAKTAQIITCLYDGNIMIDSALSAVVNVPADGKAVLMEGVMMLPDTIGEDYELRVYLWDSLMGMIPLKRTVDVY